MPLNFRGLGFKRKEDKIP